MSLTNVMSSVCFYCVIFSRFSNFSPQTVSLPVYKYNLYLQQAGINRPKKVGIRKSYTPIMRILTAVYTGLDQD